MKPFEFASDGERFHGSVEAIDGQRHYPAPVNPVKERIGAVDTLGRLQAVRVTPDDEQKSARPDYFRDALFTGLTGAG